MINYNFYDLLQNYSVFTYFLKKSFSLPDISKAQTPKEMIDLIWKELDQYCEVFPIDLHDTIQVLKNDVLMSVYTSANYTNRDPISQNEIFEKIKKMDPAFISNPNSAESERSNLSHKKASLSRAFSNMDYTGQYFDSNSLLYFAPYWLKEADNFKCFNKLDFYYYIKEYSHWPFYPDNRNGMMFAELLASFDTIYQHLKEKRQELSFDNIFSAYVFEELFYPISFSRNVTEYLSVFAHLLHDIKSPKREQAIILSRILFKMPPSLWNMVHESHYSSLAAYIANPRNITDYSNFKLNTCQMFFYLNFLYPALQTLFAMALYHGVGSDLNKTQEVLKCYIIDNLKAFDYYSPLENQMSDIQALAYPSTQKGKTIKLNGGSDKKRYNKALESFEINFTKYFYARERIRNFPEYWLTTGNPNNNFDSYMAYHIPLYSSECKDIISGTVTSNYLQFEAQKARIPKGFIV